MNTKGLTLIEAHNSGRKYRRAGQPHYWRITAIDDCTYYPSSTILATDYELEPEAKLLHREEVKQAILTSLLPHENTSHVTAFDRAAEICDQLFGEEDI